MEDVNSLLTWQYLATFTGASFLCFLIVSYTKNLLDKYWKVGTDLYGVFVGSAIILLAQTIVGGFAWSNVPLSIFNGFLIAAAAGKLNDKAVLENSKKEN
jgi:hypothetical protein